MQQVARKILGVAVLGAAFASIGAGAASADTLGPVTKSPAKAVQKTGDRTAGEVTGAVTDAKKKALKKRGKSVTVKAPAPGL